MIKAAFFDIDGTLLSYGARQVSPATVEALQALRQRGIRLFISSGRPTVLIPPMPMDFDGYVTMNGCYCYMGDRVLLRNPIPQEDTDRWLRFCQREGLCTLLFTEHEMYASSHSDPIVLAVRDQLEFDMPPYLPLEEMIGLEAYQLFAVMPASRDAEVLELLPHCRLPRWHPEFSDLINAEGSKARGIDSLISPLGIRPDECIAFGDGGNDIEMLQYCGIGVAMGNAADEVKREADYVTTSVDDDGITHALVQLGIIN